MISLIVFAVALVVNALLIYRLVTDYRRWQREQAEWERRIQSSWADLIEAAKREANDQR